MSAAPVAIRPAAPHDQDPIRALVRGERLNPTGLDWPHFIVAEDERGIVGAVQLRRHADGARELGSLVVAPAARGQGIATRLVDTLLAPQRDSVLMITDGAHAGHFRRWGFRTIDAREAPRSVRFNHRMGRLARLLSLLRRLPPRRLVVLQRPPLRPLQATDLDAVLALQGAVHGTVPPGFLRGRSREAWRRALAGAGEPAWGVFEHDVLQAAALLRLPEPARPNIGPPFPGVPDADLPLRAAFLENALVAEAARGRGLQRALIDVRLAQAEAAGMHWACAGVRLGNVASWRNLLACGLVIGGIRREPEADVLAMRRGFGPAAVHTDRHDAGRVPAGDAAGHERALRCGYLGVAVDGDGAVVYQRALARRP